MTPVIITPPCALNAKEDYSRCHGLRKPLRMEWMFSRASTQIPRAKTCISSERCGVHASGSTSPHLQKRTPFFFSFPRSTARLAASHRADGRRDEPQLLSDVNEAQTLSVCVVTAPLTASTS